MTRCPDHPPQRTQHGTQLAALAFGLEAKAAALDKNVVDLRPLLAHKALFDRGVAGR